MRRVVRTWLFVIFYLIALSCTNDRDSEIIIEVNEGIRHDDFEYLATQVWQTEFIAGRKDTLNADGVFWLVRFEVVNHAKRVSHSWDNSVAYIKDGDGRIYENLVRMQKRLDEVEPFGWQAVYKTPSQHADSTIFIFDLPNDVRKPCLMVRGKTLMGDFFNNNRFEKTKVRLFK